MALLYFFKFSGGIGQMSEWIYQVQPTSNIGYTFGKAAYQTWTSSATWLVPWLHVKSNYFSLRQCPSEIILFQRVETCLKLFQNYFRVLLQLMIIFQHVQCYWNNFRTLSAAEITVLPSVVTCDIKHRNNIKTISFHM